MNTLRTIACLGACLCAWPVFAKPGGGPAPSWRCDVSRRAEYGDLRGYVYIDSQGHPRGGYLDWLSVPRDPALHAVFSGSWAISPNGAWSWQPFVTIDFSGEGPAYSALRHHRYRIELSTQMAGSSKALPHSPFVSGWQSRGGHVFKSGMSASFGEIIANADDLAALARGSEAGLYVFARDKKGAILLSQKIPRALILDAFAGVMEVKQELLQYARNYKADCVMPHGSALDPYAGDVLVHTQ